MAHELGGGGASNSESLNINLLKADGWVGLSFLAALYPATSRCCENWKLLDVYERNESVSDPKFQCIVEQVLGGSFVSWDGHL
jgi:hypothetical protein